MAGSPPGGMATGTCDICPLNEVHQEGGSSHTEGGVERRNRTRSRLRCRRDTSTVIRADHACKRVNRDHTCVPFGSDILSGPFCLAALLLTAVAAPLATLFLPITAVYNPTEGDQAKRAERYAAPERRFLASACSDAISAQRDMGNHGVCRDSHAERFRFRISKRASACRR